MDSPSCEGELTTGMDQTVRYVQRGRLLQVCLLLLLDEFVCGARVFPPLRLRVEQIFIIAATHIQRSD